MNREQTRKYMKSFNSPQKIEQLAKELDRMARRDYEQKYRKDLDKAIETMLLVIKFVLHFSSHTKFGQKRIDSVMKDIVETFNGFTSGEYNEEEYKEMLRNEKIDI